MSVSPVVRFLENFGIAPASAPPAPADAFFVAIGATDIGDEQEDPADPVEQHEEALRAAREEGYNAARQELEAEFEKRLAAALDEARRAGEAAREAGIASLSVTLQSLLTEYDAFIDGLFEKAVRPLVAAAMQAETLERFRSMLLESADRRGLVVELSGPQSLAEPLAAVLRERGIETLMEAGDGQELVARLDGGTLRTHFARIDRVVRSLSAAEPVDD